MIPADRLTCSPEDRCVGFFVGIEAIPLAALPGRLVFGVGDIPVETTFFPAHVYQISFSPNCIWRDVVVVEVRTPAEEIGTPLAPNRLVLLVANTGDAKFV